MRNVRPVTCGRGCVGVEAQVREQVERAVEQHVELGAREVDAEAAVDAEAEAEVTVGPVAEDVERLGIAPPLRGVVIRGTDVHRDRATRRRRRRRRPWCRRSRPAAPTPAAARCGASPRSRAAPSVRSSRTAASCSGCESSMNMRLPYALYVVPAPAMISSRTKMLTSSSVSGRLSSIASASVSSMRASTSSDSRSFFGSARRSAMSGATYSATACGAAEDVAARRHADRPVEELLPVFAGEPERDADRLHRHVRAPPLRRGRPCRAA